MCVGGMSVYIFPFFSRLHLVCFIDWKVGLCGRSMHCGTLWRLHPTFFFFLSELLRLFFHLVNFGPPVSECVCVSVVAYNPRKKPDQIYLHRMNCT